MKGQIMYLFNSSRNPSRIALVALGAIVAQSAALSSIGCGRVGAAEKANQSAVAGSTAIAPSPAPTTGSAAPKAEPPAAAPHLVRFTKNSAIGSSPDARAALVRPFEDPWVVQAGTPKTTHKLRHCQDYLRLKSDDLETEDPVNQRTLLSVSGECQALKLLSQAQPSRQSFLDQIELNARFLELLPVEAYPDLSRRVKTAQKAARLAGTTATWKSFDPKLKLNAKYDPRGEPAIGLVGNGYDGELIEYGRGDVDQDGIEDLVIGRQSFPTGGSMIQVGIFLLTRTEENGPLKVLKSWRQAY